MFSDFFRFCAVCGFMFPPVHWLCPHCWKHLKKHYIPYGYAYRSEKTFPHLRLLDWEENNFFLIKRFLESLKGESPKEIMDELARECFARFSHTKVWNSFKTPTFVPPPTRSPLKKDHAGIFAEALAGYFGGEVKFILEYDPSNSPQKSKNRIERSKKKFVSKANLKNHSIIFVDDVLTTGFTAKAAYRALGQPENFLICTLAWKRPPC